MTSQLGNVAKTETINTRWFGDLSSVRQASIGSARVRLAGITSTIRADLQTNDTARPQTQDTAEAYLVHQFLKIFRFRGGCGCSREILCRPGARLESVEIPIVAVVEDCKRLNHLDGKQFDPGDCSHSDESLGRFSTRFYIQGASTWRNDLGVDLILRLSLTRQHRCVKIASTRPVQLSCRPDDFSLKLLESD